MWMLPCLDITSDAGSNHQDAGGMSAQGCRVLGICLASRSKLTFRLQPTKGLQAAERGCRRRAIAKGKAEFGIVVGESASRQSPEQEFQPRGSDGGIRQGRRVLTARVVMSQ